MSAKVFKPFIDAEARKVIAKQQDQIDALIAHVTRLTDIVNGHTQGLAWCAGQLGHPAFSDGEPKAAPGRTAAGIILPPGMGA